MRETVLRVSLTSHKRLSGSNDFALSVSISSWVCLSGEVAAAAFSGGGDNGDGGDTANSQSRGGCCDSLTVVVNTNCLWRSSVGGSRRRGNHPSHQKKIADFWAQPNVFITKVKDDRKYCGMSWLWVTGGHQFLIRLNALPQPAVAWKQMGLALENSCDFCSWIPNVQKVQQCISVSEKLRLGVLIFWWAALNRRLNMISFSRSLESFFGGRGRRGDGDGV